MLTASHYAYENNMKAQENTYKKPKKKSVRLKLVDLIRDGFLRYSKWSDDLWVCLCQWLMRKGYPQFLKITGKPGEFQEFFMDALFSYDLGLMEWLGVNRDFNLQKWREQFDKYSEIKIEGLSYYRNRVAMPLPEFTSLRDVHQTLYTNRGPYGKHWNRFVATPGKMEDNVWIIAKYCQVLQNKLVYVLEYSDKKGFENSLNGKTIWYSHQVKIESEPGENYVDFCLRLYYNYSDILRMSGYVLENTDVSHAIDNRYKLKN